MNSVDTSSSAATHLSRSRLKTFWEERQRIWLSQPAQVRLPNRQQVLVWLGVMFLGLGLMIYNYPKFQVGIHYDDAAYITLARSITQADTYGLVNFPEGPQPWNYPFGYPLLLAPFSGLFGGSLSLYKLISIFATLANASLIFWGWGILTRKLSFWWGLGVAAIYLYVPDYDRPERAGDVRAGVPDRLPDRHAAGRAGCRESKASSLVGGIVGRADVCGLHPHHRHYYGCQLRALSAAEMRQGGMEAAGADPGGQCAPDRAGGGDLANKSAGFMAEHLPERQRGGPDRGGDVNVRDRRSRRYHPNPIRCSTGKLECPGAAIAALRLPLPGGAAEAGHQPA